MHRDNIWIGRTAGIWWLAFILITSISYMFVDGKLLIIGDTVATIRNINSNQILFWFGVAAFIIGYMCFIFLAKTFYKLFISIESKLTKWMIQFVISGTVLVIIGKVAEIIAAYIGSIKDATYLLSLRNNIEMVCELFWGLWLIPLILLIFKSNLIPKIIGGALILTVFYHLTSFVVFFTSGLDVSTNEVFIILGLGEFIMTLWLLIMGTKKGKE